MAPKVFGMISTAKSVEYTWYALHTFFAATELSPSDEVHLIDNDSGSLDETRLKERFPRVQFFAQPSPASFAANMNRIVARARELSADAYLLNNDLIFAPGWLPPLAVEEKALMTPVCNMQAPYRNKSLELRLTMSLKDYLGNEKEFLEVAAHHMQKHRGYQLVHSVPYYCIKIPCSVYSEVGFFDESYSNAGFEDADYTMRCWEKEIPLYFAMGSYVLHFYGKSSWTADSGPLPVHPDPKIGKRGELLFRKRWGDETAEIFALQNEAGINRLHELETEAKRELYVRLARQARDHRNAKGEITEP